MPKDSTIADLEDLHRKAKTARGKLDPVWFMNMAYTAGDQWLIWDGRQLTKPTLRKSRITIVDNRILPCVQTEIAKLTKSRPVFVSTPRTGDDEDVNAAQLAEQVMRHLWLHLHIQPKFTKALRWSRICCAGFLKTFWDPTVGEGTQVLVGPDGKPLADAQGSPMKADQFDPAQLSQHLGVPIQAKQINQGDICVEVRSPFQMFPDPLADSFVEVEWLIEESVKSVEHVKRRYGVELVADTTANPGLVESRMGASFTPGAGGYKGVKVREYWSNPSSTHPNGRRCVWAQKKILFEDDKPFDPMPYVMLSSIPIPGRLWPTSIVEQLRGPQTELNKVKSQIAENRNRVGNPTLLASKQAVQDADNFERSTTVPGGVYYFDETGSQNAVPTYLNAPPLPTYVVDEIARIEESIQEISGQHEVTSANVPPGVTAASAINLLMEADDTRLGPAVTDMEEQLGAFGSKILNLVARYYTDNRTIRIAGENNSWEIKDFRGAQLRDNTRVEVQAGSAFPQSKAAKQAWMQDLLTFFVQSGNPPHGKQLAQFLKDFGMGGAERLLEEYTRDETQVNRENQRLSQGQQVPINDFDNDEAHIAGHTDFQKSARYDQLSPQIKAVFEQHVTAHRQRLAQAQAAQMQMQQQAAQPPGAQEQQGQQLQMQMAQAAQQGQQDQAQSQQELAHTENEHQQQLRHQQEQHDLQMRLKAQQAQQATQQRGSQNARR